MENNVYLQALWPYVGETIERLISVWSKTLKQRLWRNRNKFLDYLLENSVDDELIKIVLMEILCPDFDLLPWKMPQGIDVDFRNIKNLSEIFSPNVCFFLVIHQTVVLGKALEFASASYLFYKKEKHIEVLAEALFGVDEEDKTFATNIVLTLAKNDFRLAIFLADQALPEWFKTNLDIWLKEKNLMSASEAEAIMESLFYNDVPRAQNVGELLASVHRLIAAKGLPKDWRYYATFVRQIFTFVDKREHPEKVEDTHRLIFQTYKDLLQSKEEEWQLKYILNLTNLPDDVRSEIKGIQERLSQSYDRKRKRDKNNEKRKRNILNLLNSALLSE